MELHLYLACTLWILLILRKILDISHVSKDAQDERTNTKGLNLGAFDKGN